MELSMKTHLLTDKRLMLLMPESTYRAEPFLKAAQELGLEAVVASDRCHVLADYWHVPLALKFRYPDQAVQDIIDYAKANSVQAIIPVDDKTTVIAAKACEALSLPHNAPEAAEAALNKRRMRELLMASDVPCPDFDVFEMSADPAQISNTIAYPCVLKPLLLSASQGVIRADTPAEFIAAFNRICRILQSLPLSPADPDAGKILAEAFITGTEIAIEGIISQAKLRVLAVFDKPDPLDGPFFEETIYVTPSRLSEDVLHDVVDATEQAIRAIGLTEGPVHAELRVNDEGPWIVEVAGRSIGGLCSRTLQFGLGISLEELILRHSFGIDINQLGRQDHAAGVMMLPVPEGGILTSVSGIDQAEQVTGIEAVVITAKPGEILVPLPEGSSYPGFIHARGETPELVEQALRTAHGTLEFRLTEPLPLAAH
ncbi:MAG: ATP-grasp domain-containing protein [Gemmatimonadota bacterium]|nr:ATP-grasp domain-containing protein [Gemmatimonadota bacterium]